MSIYTKTPLAVAIENALTHIPIVWPLQQFIATNPLWDLVAQPIDKATDVISQAVNVRATLSLSDYCAYYRDKKITAVAIYQAIEESIASNNNNNVENEKDTVAENLYQQLLYRFMISVTYQKKLIAASLSKGDSDRAEHAILFSDQIKLYGYDNALDAIQSDCLNWLTGYFNPTNFQYNVINCHHEKKKTQHFFHLWRATMSSKNKNWQNFLAQYPDDITSFIQKLLTDLAIPEAALNHYVFAICWQLKGWIGYIKWQKTYPQNPYVNRSVDVVEVIAMWLAYEVFWLMTHRRELAKFKPKYDINCNTAVKNSKLHNPVQALWLHYIDTVNKQLSEQTTKYIRNLACHYQLSEQRLCWLWQRAYELSYQVPLYQTLLSRKQHAIMQTHAKTSQAQWVFCIDVRSEGLRRHLERLGNYETFGFAGFFGFAYQLDNQEVQLTCQCPALIEPTLLVKMLSSESLCKRSSNAITASIDRNKKSLLSAFVLYEMVGLWFALTLWIKNYAIFI